MIDFASIVKKAAQQVFAASPAYEEPLQSDTAIVTALGKTTGGALALLDGLDASIANGTRYSVEQAKELLKLLGSQDSWFSRFGKEARKSGLLGKAFFDADAYRIRHQQYSGLSKMAADDIQAPQAGAVLRALEEVKGNIPQAKKLVQEISDKYQAGKSELSAKPEDARFLAGFQHMYEDFLLDDKLGVVPVLKRLLGEAAKAPVAPVGEKKQEAQPSTQQAEVPKGEGPAPEGQKAEPPKGDEPQPEGKKVEEPQPEGQKVDEQKVNGPASKKEAPEGQKADEQKAQEPTSEKKEPAEQEAQLSPEDYEGLDVDVRKIMEQTIPETAKALEEAHKELGEDLVDIVHSDLVAPWGKVIKDAASMGLLADGRFDMGTFKRFAKRSGAADTKLASFSLGEALQGIAKTAGIHPAELLKNRKEALEGLLVSYRKGLKELAAESAPGYLVRLLGRSVSELFVGKGNSILSSLKDTVSIAVARKKQKMETPADAKALDDTKISDTSDLAGDKLAVYDRLMQDTGSSYKALYLMYAKKLANHSFLGDRAWEVGDGDKAEFAAKMDQRRADSIPRWKKILDQVKPELDALDDAESKLDDKGKAVVSTYRKDRDKWGRIMSELDTCLVSRRWDAYLGKAKQGLKEALAVYRDPRAYAIRHKEQQEAKEFLREHGYKGRFKQKKVVKTSNPFHSQLDSYQKKLSDLQMSIANIIKSSPLVYPTSDRDLRSDANRLRRATWLSRRLLSFQLIGKIRFFKRAKTRAELSQALETEKMTLEDFSAALSPLGTRLEALHVRNEFGEDPQESYSNAEAYGKEIDAFFAGIAASKSTLFPVPRIPKDAADEAKLEQEVGKEEAASTTLDAEDDDTETVPEPEPEVTLIPTLLDEHKKLAEGLSRVIKALDANTVPKDARESVEASMAELVATLSAMGFNEDGSFDHDKFASYKAPVEAGAAGARTAALSLERERRRVLAEGVRPLKVKLENQVGSFANIVKHGLVGEKLQKIWDALKGKVSAWLTDSNRAMGGGQTPSTLPEAVPGVQQDPSSQPEVAPGVQQTPTTPVPDKSTNDSPVGSDTIVHGPADHTNHPTRRGETPFKEWVLSYLEKWAKANPLPEGVTVEKLLEVAGKKLSEQGFLESDAGKALAHPNDKNIKVLFPPPPQSADKGRVDSTTLTKEALIGKLNAWAKGTGNKTYNSALGSEKSRERWVKALEQVQGAVEGSPAIAAATALLEEGKTKDALKTFLDAVLQEKSTNAEPTGTSIPTELSKDADDFAGTLFRLSGSINDVMDKVSVLENAGEKENSFFQAFDGMLNYPANHDFKESFKVLEDHWDPTGLTSENLAAMAGSLKFLSNREDGPDEKKALMDFALKISPKTPENTQGKNAAWIAVRLASETLHLAGTEYSVAIRSDLSGGTYKAQAKTEGFPYTVQEFFADYQKQPHLRSGNFKAAYEAVWNAARDAIMGNLMAGTTVEGKTLASTERSGKALQTAAGRIIAKVLGPSTEVTPRDHFHRTIKIFQDSRASVPGLYPPGRIPPMPSGPSKIPFSNTPKPSKAPAPKNPPRQTNLFDQESP